MLGSVGELGVGVQAKAWGEAAQYPGHNVHIHAATMNSVHFFYTFLLLY